MIRIVIACVIAATAACGGSKQAPSAPATSSETGNATGSDATTEGMTAEQCAAAGGQVVGDIGDGAVHRPDYRCPQSGNPPLGHIVAEPGQPMAVEGAVCCH